MPSSLSACRVSFAMRKKVISAACVLAVWTSTNVLGDSWGFERSRKATSFTFGDVKIESIVDGRKNQKYPDFWLELSNRGRLLLRVKDVSVEHVFASPDQKTFVGLSNNGLPGSAVVLLSNEGGLMHIARHGLARFNYCTETTTLDRTWYDARKPEVRFLPAGDRSTISGILVRDCHGKSVDILEATYKAYNSAFERAEKYRGSR